MKRGEIWSAPPARQFGQSDGSVASYTTTASTRPTLSDRRLHDRPDHAPLFRLPVEPDDTQRPARVIPPPVDNITKTIPKGEARHAQRPAEAMSTCCSQTALCSCFLGVAGDVPPVADGRNAVASASSKAMWR